VSGPTPRDSASESSLPTAVPDGYTVRAATRADFDSLVTMLHAADLADWGEPDFSAEFLEFEWSFPQMNLATDTWLVTQAATGEPCAYAWLLARDEHRELDGWGVVHPEHRGRGLGSALLDRVERRAREHARDAPDAAGSTWRWGVIAPDVAAHRLLEARGLIEERHTWRMETRVGPDTREPGALEGITIRPFDPSRDAAAVHAALEESFAAHYGYVGRSLEEWTALRIDRPTFDPSLWRVAESGEGEVAGAAIGGIADGTGFVETLGVVPGWRGRGIGIAILRSCFAEFGRRGIEQVALEVDSQNATGAVRLYERAGMTATRQFDTFAKHIAPTER
jgi:mycothiol synthase